MLEKNALNLIKKGKNLLAFSHGVDSTALFYILAEQNIKFDIAFVNYNTREQSMQEELSAKALALEFNKKIFIKSVYSSLDTSNFEKIARDIRYEFFNEICSKFDYENLITAHQLNDKLEWFLMRLSKGSGLTNLLSMQSIDKKEKFTIIRPFIDTSRDEILDFLDKKGVRYFIDSSNLDTNFERNFIRAEFGDKFISKFKNGVKKSFNFLQNDKNILLKGEIYNDGKFFILENLPNSMNLIDKCLKISGIVMSKNQRLQAQNDCVISGKVAICYTNDRVFIAPYKKAIMNKKFKEFCRIKKIPPLIRGYLFNNQNLLNEI